MLHAKSLRVIGQTLEAAGVPTFEIEKYGPQYMVWSSSVSGPGETMIRTALRQNHDLAKVRQAVSAVFCFGSAEISRLDAEARIKRRNQSSSPTPADRLVSHGLRTLGDQFDRMQVHAFRIDWASGSVIIDYQQASAARHCKMLTFADLRYLCERAKGHRQDLAINLLLV